MVRVAYVCLTFHNRIRTLRKPAGVEFHIGKYDRSVEWMYPLLAHSGKTEQ